MAKSKKRLHFVGAQGTGKTTIARELFGDNIIDGFKYTHDNIMDDMPVLEFFRDNSQKETREFVTAFLGNVDFFGQDLNEVAGLTDAVAAYLVDIKANGMRAALCKIS